ncbi:hypothetical protein IMSAGC013_04593 [Lachnospiraceae bacterium]|nr:hypothetical protein IMSAGC013_04593 [Lachnospiraceae bacterium]
MLDKQYNMYSVDTGHFYSNHEKYLHDMNCKYRRERNYVQNKLPEIEKKLKQFRYTEDDIKNLKNDKTEEVDIIESSYDTVSEYLHWTKLIRHKREKAKESKEKLLTLLSNKVNQNELTDGKNHLRTIKEDSLNDTNIISVFDSALSRTIGIKQDELTDALIVVQVYYFDVFKDISFYGFIYKGEKYKYFTSSAGQIRKKKAVFIKESVWNKIEKTVMCGLTIDKINSKGGNNVNKHLAYMALTNSATDEWNEFDIDRSIVIDDFETDVYGTFDFVDETDYSITRKIDYVPIPHTDGAGMILPSVSSKNFMFRAPWIKGLLGVFNFRKFVEVNDYSPIATDIYGQEHDIIKEDIQIIFTKSQFKMAKFYDSWDEYKDAFKKYHCSAGKCNVEEDRIKNAKINYQMLQTLTNITDDEIHLLTQKSFERISNICNSKDTMMDTLGITPYNTNMTAFQKAVKLYPSLLNDTYAKDVIREVKNSLLKKYRSGKLEVNGKYTFLLPDFYAACEYWFGHIDTPTGLLSDKEVFCWLFRRYEKLDCLRSPHLYKEHAIRFNIANEVYGDRSKLIREWFTTDGIYASTHDLISKILMYDVDGDKSLVVADKDFVRIAERNMNGIVPLYYNMRKAEPTQLNNKNIYAGLNAAFTGGNIGIYSNNISKIWNDDIFISGTDSEKSEAIDCVKRLCCQNNFVIDYAKTLYKPEFPHEINEKIAQYTNCKLPAFFEYAKDKDKSQVKKRNGSFVNKIYDRIPNKPINTRGLKLEKIDYQKLMSNPRIICSKEVSDLYDELNKQYRYMINMKDEYIDNLRYIACKIREKFSKFGYSEETITDMLVEYLYGNGKRYKQLLWFCYGQYVVNSLERNIEVKKTKFIQCIDCGEWIEVGIKDNKTYRCEKCQSDYRKKYQRELMRKRRNVSTTN